MFSSNSTGRDDARHLLGRDNNQEDEDHEVVWEQSSSHSKRHDSESELWEQDPLSSEAESHELHQIPTPESRATSSQPRSKRAKAPPVDHGVAGTDLQAEFERIFSPVKHDQEEKAKYHAELDAACAAYSARKEEMHSLQRERETAIENPWLTARRRREWQRAAVVLKNIGIVLTCFYGGRVARLEELPPQVPWPPPHLTRMRDHHAEEQKALREAHLAVVHELGVKFGLEQPAELQLEGQGQQEQHICVERRLLEEVLGGVTMPLDDGTEESEVP